VRPYPIIPNTKRAGGGAQDVDPEFKPQYHNKKKKKNWDGFNKAVVETSKIP
jgi:hypothetical protein